MTNQDPHEKTRTVAIIQSLEQQRNEALTAKVQADASVAVLKELLTMERQKIAALEKAAEEAKAVPEPQSVCTKPAANGAEQPQA